MQLYKLGISERSCDHDIFCASKLDAPPTSDQNALRCSGRSEHVLPYLRPPGFELFHCIDCETMPPYLFGVVANYGRRHADNRPNLVLRAPHLKKHDHGILAQPLRYDSVFAQTLHCGRDFSVVGPASPAVS
jgi:hypothetical protein